MARRNRFTRPVQEFRPDKREFNWFKYLYMTRQQRLKLLKWGLYSMLCLLMLVIQDVIVSRFTIFGANTDLAVCAILLITVMEGAESGSIFVLLASLLFFFSGSSPGAFCIAAMTFLGIMAALFRQAFWHRNFSSIVLCAGVAMMIYELVSFAAGIAMHFTLLSRVGVFLVTGGLSWLVMVPLYPVIRAIGKIGGESWKE